MPIVIILIHKLLVTFVDLTNTTSKSIKNFVINVIKILMPSVLYYKFLVLTDQPISVINFVLILTQTIVIVMKINSFRVAFPIVNFVILIISYWRLPKYVSLLMS